LGLAHLATTPAHAEVAAFDCVEECRPIDLLDPGEHECGVSLDPRQLEVRSECCNDHADQVRQDVVDVVEFDTGEVRVDSWWRCWAWRPR
jgi:hypothetical protein